MSKKIIVPGPPVGYTDLMDYELIERQKWFREQVEKGEFKPYFPLRPSSAGKCTRLLAYQMMEYTGKAKYDWKPNSPQLDRLFDLGHWIESHVLKKFKAVKIVRQAYAQAPMIVTQLEKLDQDTQEKYIIGSCDVCFINEKWKCVVDVKSQKDGFSRAFKTRWDEKLDKFDRMASLTKVSDTCWYADDVVQFVQDLGDDFLVGNILQLNLYACSDFMVKAGMDHAVIWKYNKNDSRHYELRFRPDQRLVKYVKSKFDRANFAAHIGEPERAERDYALGSFTCMNCERSKECWGEGEDPRREWINRLPPKAWSKKMTRMKSSEVGGLRGLFREYEQNLDTLQNSKKTEQLIVEDLNKKQIKKIQLDNGHVYEVKYLKSPTPHFELRRSKD